MKNEKSFLKQAVELARIAGLEGNHPCGTVIIDSDDGQLVASSGNKVFTTPDITAHAEILCLRQRSKLLMNKSNDKAFVLFSSCEPCCGCAFYIARTNISRIVYACREI